MKIRLFDYLIIMVRIISYQDIVLIYISFHVQHFKIQDIQGQQLHTSLFKMQYPTTPIS